ncbi:FAD/NAD(P)-binding protein [Mongoliimonas terrestris]|uniref:FAD/NAD(P)-binding protein n=1 Tax=Mongoliimonas terrestris TaxID=1709001 RepID=UPI0009496FB4|nr:FAD/NAD(P)-binding protein [Mongoliimonas terrestris]
MIPVPIWPRFLSLRPTERPVRIGIVGCGLTGAAAAVAVADRFRRPVDLTLVDASGRFGYGLAYGEGALAGLTLNVRARDLSLFPDRPDDFVDWLIHRGHGPRPEISAGFPERSRFGAYVADRLADRLKGRRDLSATLLTDTAIAGHPVDDGIEIAFRRSPARRFDAVFLATGWGLPATPRRFGRSPFAPLPEGLKPLDRILIVGTGLSMVDTLLTLRAAGHDGPIEAISRCALLPHPHTTDPADPGLVDLRTVGSLSGLVRAVRRTMATREKAGGSWQGVANVARSQVQDVWTSFGVADRQRFLTHVAPYWENARHRLPMGHYAFLMSEIEGGRLILRSGKVRSVEQVTDGYRTILEEAPAEGLVHDHVFDCTGHRPAVESPLIRSLAAQGLVRLDPLRLGLDVARSGRARLRRGIATAPVFALGPLGRGSLYEITGVREIVEQAFRAVDAIDKLERRKARGDQAPAAWDVFAFR